MTVSELLTSVSAISTSYNNVNDLRINPDTFKIAIVDREIGGKKEARPVLVDSTGTQYSATERQLAFLRVIEDPTKVPTWTSEFKGNFLADVLRNQLSSGASLENAKFKVVGQLQIHDDSAANGNTPVYVNSAYNGVADFDEKHAALRRGKDQAYFMSSEYRSDMKVLRNKLRATGVKSGMNTTEHIVYVPVFVVTF